MKEFNKILDEKAYTWYSGLVAHSIRSWREMTQAFIGKFFNMEEKFTILDLRRKK